MKTNAIVVLTLAASALIVSAQQPQVRNTQLHSTPLSMGLSATVDRFRHSQSPLWVGFAVQALPGAHASACSSWAQSSTVDGGCCDEVRLEDASDHLSAAELSGLPQPVVSVLLRIDHGEVVKVRIAPIRCTLNVGGLAMEWLTGAGAEESAVLLGRLAADAAARQDGSDESKQLMDESLAALSVEATARATTVLAELANETDPRLREKAAFWLGAQRGHDGLLTLRKLVQSEPNSKLREKLTFDFSINSDPEALTDLIQLAKSDTDSRVRGQALFWLAQKAGKKALGALHEAISNDPDFEVKKRAVFALSQLPKEESVPQLVHVADTNANFAIRKEAIFWLGQSSDPRALAYIEQVLKK